MGRVGWGAGRDWWPRVSGLGVAEPGAGEMALYFYRRFCEADRPVEGAVSVQSPISAGALKARGALQRCLIRRREEVRQPPSLLPTGGDDRQQPPCEAAAHVAV